MLSGLAFPRVGQSRDGGREVGASRGRFEQGRVETVGQLFVGVEGEGALRRLRHDTLDQLLQSGGVCGFWNGSFDGEWSDW